jgi:hypothetical protein
MVELQAFAGDLPVPITSIHSRSDGIVNWRHLPGPPVRSR